LESESNVVSPWWKRTDLGTDAKVSFQQKCQAAGVQIMWGEDHVTHHEMARRAQPSGTNPRAATTTGGAKPAKFTGAAAPRDVAGSMLGFVAAVAAAAAI
jgi:hypothetical protein